jgi:hypothetical protein
MANSKAIAFNSTQKGQQRSSLKSPDQLKSVLNNAIPSNA